MERLIERLKKQIQQVIDHRRCVENEIAESKAKLQSYTEEEMDLKLALQIANNHKSYMNNE